jgi:hypothetical protein
MSCLFVLSAGCATPEPPPPKPRAQGIAGESIEFVVPEFASPFSQGTKAVEDALAKTLLAHVKVGQRYVYTISTAQHEMTMVQEVVSIGGPEVRFAQTYVNDTGTMPCREERHFRVPGELLEKIPPLRTDRLWIAGLGERECLVWVMGELEIWAASVDGKPTFPGLVKVRSPTSSLRLVWVGTG